MKKIFKPLSYFMIVLLALSVALVGCTKHQANENREKVNKVQKKVALDTRMYRNENNTRVYKDNVPMKNQLNPNVPMNNVTNRPNVPIRSELGTNLAAPNLLQTQKSMIPRCNKISHSVNAVNGVNKSTCCIKGNRAIVAVDLNKTAHPELTDAMQNKIKSACKSADPNIKHVIVTSDPAMYQKLGKIREDLKSNRAIVNFENVFQNMLNKIPNK